jgi:tetratricopeptide (TPR) repeat protein
METNTLINTEKLIEEAKYCERNNFLNKAITLYETAIAHNRSSFGVYYNLGALYEKINDTSNAKSVYKMGIDMAKKHDNKRIETELSYTLLGLID